MIGDDILADEQDAEIQAAVADWPPLTPKQRETLAMIFSATPLPTQHISERNEP